MAASHAPMTADDQRRPASARPPRRYRRLRGIARRVLWLAARPYARRRLREAEMASALTRLEADFERVRVRHSEQIERLEDVARELVLTAESLRRVSARKDGEA